MKGRRPDLKAVDGGLLKAPPLPSTLPKSLAKEWREVAADLVGRGLLNQSSISVLETYFRALWVARECQNAMVEHGPLVLNAARILRPNPAASMMADANMVIGRIAYEMGISAAGRNLPTIKKKTRAADASDDPFEEFEL